VLGTRQQIEEMKGNIRWGNCWFWEGVILWFFLIRSAIAGIIKKAFR